MVRPSFRLDYHGRIRHHPHFILLRSTCFQRALRRTNSKQRILRNHRRLAKRTQQRRECWHYHRGLRQRILHPPFRVPKGSSGVPRFNLLLHLHLILFAKSSSTARRPVALRNSMGCLCNNSPGLRIKVCPLALRGYLTVYVNLCWALGQLISAGVQAGFSERVGQWSYRVPFAIQWVWPLPLFAILWFAPESPWYFVRLGKYDQAEMSILRLSSPSQRSQAKQKVAMMIHTNEIEAQMDEGTSYMDCFRGVDLRKTEIACLAFAAQPFCGSAMGGTPTYFFVQAGLSTSISFQMSVGGLGIASVGTIVAWGLLHMCGRRTLYLCGLGLLTLILVVVGSISAGAPNSDAANYGQAGMMLAWLAVYYLTVGPICYAIISEVSSTRLRNKSVCLSRITYYVAQIICSIINPYMVSIYSLKLATTLRDHYNNPEPSSIRQREAGKARLLSFGADVRLSSSSGHTSGCLRLRARLLKSLTSCLLEVSRHRTLLPTKSMHMQAGRRL